MDDGGFASVCAEMLSSRDAVLEVLLNEGLYASRLGVTLGGQESPLLKDRAVSRRLCRFLWGLPSRQTACVYTNPHPRAANFTSQTLQ